MHQYELIEKISSLSQEQIEGNQKSWERVANLFGDWAIAYPKYNATVYELIKLVVITDFTKLFRAGQSMWTLIISTETQNRFTYHQPFIAIEVEENLTTQIKYMYTKEHIVLEKETWIFNTNPLKILEPYLVRLWNETRERK